MQRLRREWELFLAVPVAEAGPWAPRADVYRGASKWLVKLDLAGVRPEDVEVRVRGRRVTVRGVRRDFSVLEGRESYSMEISYNRFERSIDLPVELDRSEIRTEYRDGMFLLEILIGTAE
jgi:HSP20 family protein